VILRIILKHDYEIAPNIIQVVACVAALTDSDRAATIALAIVLSTSDKTSLRKDWHPQ